MTEDTVSANNKTAKSPRVQHRERRLKAALKANMAKRKGQVRGRSDPVAADDMTGDIPTDKNVKNT